MKIFGIEVHRVRAQTYQLVPSQNTGFFGVIRESFAGAFGSNVTVDGQRNLLAFSAVYSCVALIAGDIAKLPLRLMNQVYKGNTWEDVTDQRPAGDVLTRPNRYQTQAQFIESWIISKLLFGNTYVLKERDPRGQVDALYVLCPQRVKPLVAEDGGVYYEISTDNLSGVTQTIMVPASEVIHDRSATLWHPLVGISPIYACGVSATMGNRIQNNSARFFENLSRPSGMLTAPGTINDETASRIKTTFESNFSGGNLGRLFMGGDGLKYEAMTIAAADAQLIEQLRWTVEDVARCFRIPLHMIGAGVVPTHTSAAALEQNYFSQTLQGLIEQLEQCLTAGLGLPRFQRAEFDLDGLLRMDAQALYTALGEGVKGGWMAPNEARERVNLPPVPGGNTPYLQVQNYSLAALDRRDRAAAAPTTAGSSGAPSNA